MVGDKGHTTASPRRQHDLRGPVRAADRQGRSSALLETIGGRTPPGAGLVGILGLRRRKRIGFDRGVLHGGLHGRARPAGSTSPMTSSGTGAADHLTTTTSSRGGRRTDQRRLRPAESADGALFDALIATEHAPPSTWSPAPGGWRGVPAFDAGRQLIWSRRQLAQQPAAGASRRS